MPPPTTAIRFGESVGAMINSVSWQACGLTRQDVSLPANVWSRQAWLQAMQVLIRSACPAAALVTNRGSARNGRAIDTMSASPSANTCSATSGVLIRLVATTGMPTAALTLPLTHANPARGTLVAIVGIRASCQPIPVLSMVAPAASTPRASSTTSSSVEPSSTRSIIESR
ncbi:MAG: hypothetical protein BWY91_00824 [bacterium ADurb.BinA028]|nr:MAG: hypothetical protein BWY91_00824 [bacterium ADurb.BinA028]